MKKVLFKSDSITTKVHGIRVTPGPETDDCKSEEQSVTMEMSEITNGNLLESCLDQTADSEESTSQVKTNGSYERIIRRESTATLASRFACHSLNYTQRKLLPLKHYHDEARAMRDINKFLADPVVLFKLHHTTVHDIVGEMLTKLAVKKPQLGLDTEKLMRCIVEDNSDVKLMEVMQAIGTDEHNAPETEPSFLTILCNSNSIQESHVVMCLLHNPINLGSGAEEVHFICLIVSPVKEKKIKSAVEVARTYSTLLADYRLRRRLLQAHDAKEFTHLFELEVHRIYTEQRDEMRRKDSIVGVEMEKWCFGRDLIHDIERRLSFYLSDFTEGMKTCSSIQKILSTIFFLYFSLIMPCIAFGVLFHSITHGVIDVRKTVLSQAISGLIFSLVGGQPLLIVRTTIPISIYMKVIYSLSESNGMSFYSFYALTGLWSSFFLFIFALTGFSKMMKYCSRSTEEIFALFISIAFTVDSIKFMYHEFDIEFCFDGAGSGCNAAKALVSLILMLGTVWVGCEIYNFRFSPYLSEAKRVLVADYALPTAVLLMSFIGSFLFRKVEMDTFNDDQPAMFTMTGLFTDVSVGMVFGSMGLGLCLSVLIFMDQNIASNIVNSPANRLRKGSAYHLDLLITGIINIINSLFCLPLIHGALPHSPLHVRALADIEEHIDHGHVKEIVVYVRETRVSTLVSHILIALSILMIPSPLNFIPIPVLYGLFVFLAIAALGDLQIWERMLLIFTEQNSYPPTHYIRKVPQRMVHSFTFIQLFQLAILCGLSFSGSPYLKMLFPVLLALMLPIRAKLIPRIIPKRFLDALDGHL